MLVCGVVRKCLVFFLSLVLKKVQVEVAVVLVLSTFVGGLWCEEWSGVFSL